jgi:hypothetical protein
MERGSELDLPKVLPHQGATIIQPGVCHMGGRLNDKLRERSNTTMTFWDRLVHRSPNFPSNCMVFGLFSDTVS